MKKILKIFAVIILFLFFIFAYGYYVNKKSFGTWKIQKQNKLNYTDFIWTNDTIGGKYFEKTAMLIPCKIKGIENILTFQFDLGSDKSMIYENSFNSISSLKKKQVGNIRNLDFPLNFIKSKKVYEDLEISFGQYNIFNKRAFVEGNYGKEYSKKEIENNDTLHMGTIGADIFQGRVLIIDYPNKKFAITDEVPSDFKNNLIDIELNSDGLAILPLFIKSKEYKMTFDNGSSIFPLIATSKNIKKFTSNPIIDSLEVSSWGVKHILDSRMVTDTFLLGGKKFCNVKIYENHLGRGITKKTDGMTGNYLFWNNKIVIDFKNKKFGVE